jgi:hypothetical protein
VLVLHGFNVFVLDEMVDIRGWLGRSVGHWMHTKAQAARQLRISGLGTAALATFALQVSVFALQVSVFALQVSVWPYVSFSQDSANRR